MLFFSESGKEGNIYFNIYYKPDIDLGSKFS